ncbi:MAG: polyketide synthase dehydratase domain-containing protein [Pirellulales bacterium]|nr:polyketide synthase dehydratase domain-containing protein [Pirellulales bacterium]
MTPPPHAGSVADGPAPQASPRSTAQATAIQATVNELFVFAAPDRARLIAAIEHCQQQVAAQPALDLSELAGALASAPLDPPSLRLAIIAGQRDDLLKRLERARGRLADADCHQIQDVTGLYFTDRPLAPRGKLAFLFPGEGAQYLGMLGELVHQFDVVRDCFTWCDERLAISQTQERPISRFIDVPTDIATAERAALDNELRSLDNAMLSVLAADWGIHQVLEGLGVEPDVVLGHSAGELAALRAAGVFDRDDESPITGMLRTLREQEDASDAHAGVLLAAGIAPRAAADLLAQLTSAGTPQIELVHVAMENCPHQTVLVGPPAPMAAVEAALQSRKTMYERLSLARPYHTPLFEPLLGPLADMFAGVRFSAPSRPVYSATTGQPFPADPAAIRSLALAHWASPVRFIDAIENLYAAGVRIFVEAGPRGNLSSFVEDTLRGREFLAVPADVQRRGGMTQLLHLVAQLFVHGVPVRLAYLHPSRATQPTCEPSNTTPIEPMPARFTIPQESNAPAATELPLPLAVAEPTLAPMNQFPGAETRGGRAEVMQRHLALSEQFLADQQAITEQFLARRRGVRTNRLAPQLWRTPPEITPLAAVPTIPSEPVATPGSVPATVAAPCEIPHDLLSVPGPLVSEIVEHVAGERIVMRRRLDLSEDLYAEDHTVGGREVSKVDPNQHGLPVMPMTFTLEMMAEVAARLVPGHAPISVNDVTLIRWLALDDPISTVEVKASIEQRPDVPAEQVSVRVEVRDLGPDAGVEEANNGSAKRGAVAALGRVLLAQRYPIPPAPKPAAFTSARPNTIGLYELYRGLFHGPRFQGVTQLNGFGDEGIEATIQIQPRDNLFASRREPGFLLDPVTIDVAMHPAAGWHLEQPDQAGRVLLPYELGKIEFFSPPPAAGTELKVRTWIAHASARRFTHDGDVFTPEGRLWCRFTGVKCWRFYLPVDKVNFHGPKDEYFISRDWPIAAPPTPAETAPAETRSWAVLLEPSDDLVQPGMLAAAVRVTLSPVEQAAFRAVKEDDQRAGWLFGRVAAKDAARILWRHQCGERLYPSDIEIEAEPDGSVGATLRSNERPVGFPRIDFACTRRAMVGIASLDGRPGAALVRLDEFSVDEAGASSASELLLFEGAGIAPDEAAARLAVARQALRRALGPQRAEELARLVPQRFDHHRGILEFEPADALASRVGHRLHSPLAVRTAREGDLIVAAACCPEIAP